MNTVNVRGIIRQIDEKNTVVSDTWNVRKFVLTLNNDPKHPQVRQYQSVRGTMSELDKFQVGDEVEVEVFLRGREFPSREDRKKLSYYPIDEVSKITLIVK